MRPSHAILALAVLASGCSFEVGAPASRLPSASALAASPSASAAAALSPSVAPSSPLEPDWSALPSLEPIVIATAPLTAGWPTLFASATDAGIWVPNGDEGDGPPAVARLDPETMALVATIEVGGQEGASPPDGWATAVSVDGVWVALAHEQEVVLIDPATNAVSRRLEVDAVPYSLAEDGDSLWIVDFERSAVLRIDRVSGEELLRVQGIRDPIEIAVGEEGVWVTEHRQGNLVRLDPETGEELARLGVGGRPGVAIGFGSVWARSDDDRVVSRIDPVTNRVVETIAMPGNPVDFAVAGDALWVVTRPQRGACERNSQLVRIDPASSMPDGIMDLSCAFGIATDGRSLWAASGEGDAASIARIDTAQR